MQWCWANQHGCGAQKWAQMNIKCVLEMKQCGAERVQMATKLFSVWILSGKAPVKEIVGNVITSRKPFLRNTQWRSKTYISDSTIFKAWTWESGYSWESCGCYHWAAEKIWPRRIVHGGSGKLHLPQQLPHIWQEGGMAAGNIREALGCREKTR